MEVGAITSYIDVAQIVLYAFWFFFAGLIFYLRREDRREGYPLISEVTGQPMDHGFLWIPPPKTFKLADGRVGSAPNGKTDTRTLKAAPRESWSGAPLYATGDAMADGVGPASYAERDDIADVTFEGHTRIVPLRAAPGFIIEPNDPDPRGMAVMGGDHVAGGSVVDVWVDRSESIVRYLEVDVGMRGQAGNGDGSRGQRVLLPINFAQIDGRRRRVNVHAITAAQFAKVPGHKSADAVTRLEEDRICGFYGGGMLYATPQRQESFL